MKVHKFHKMYQTRINKQNHKVLLATWNVKLRNRHWPKPCLQVQDGSQIEAHNHFQKQLAPQIWSAQTTRPNRNTNPRPAAADDCEPQQICAHQTSQPMYGVAPTKCALAATFAVSLPTLWLGVNCAPLGKSSQQSRAAASIRCGCQRIPKWCTSPNWARQPPARASPNGVRVVC